VGRAFLVSGRAAISIDYFKRLLGILRNIVGGRVTAYESLVAGYGHAGGVTDFFSCLAGESGIKAANFLASHPHPEDRISALKKMTGEKGYRVGLGVPYPGLKGDAIHSHLVTRV
jgi:hypothetical protein